MLKNAKTYGIIGLVLLLISQVLLYQGFDFIQAQKPVDFAHWFLLIGASLAVSFCFVFPKSIFSAIANPLIVLGAIAHIGMCALDFVFWSFGDDYTSRDELIGHLINIPWIWYPFMVIGPSLLYIGLATHAWRFIKSHTLIAALTLVSSAFIGLGQFMWEDRIFVVLGMFGFAIGLVLLLYRKEA